MTPLRDPHGVLGLRPGARPDEVLSAYLRLRRALRSDSPALVSLDCDAARREELARVEEAFRALSLNLAAGPAGGPSRRAPLPGSSPPPRLAAPRRGGDA